MKKILSAVFLLSIFLGIAYPERVGFGTYDFTIDLPEGFKLTNSNNKDRFMFSSLLLPCKLQISFDAKTKFAGTAQAADNISSQLRATRKDLEFLWCEKRGLFSTITFSLDDGYLGWVMVLELQNAWLTLTGFSKKTDAKLCEAMIISAFDSVTISQGSYYVPGPVTACLYPRQAAEKKTVIFDGSTLSFFADKIDQEANKSVVDREFEILTHYLNTEYVVSAWKRYYLCIFRDSWKRLQSFSFEIKNDLAAKNLLADKSAVVKKVLEFVQNFTYVRDHSGTDFVDLATAASERTGDCDTRSLLMNVILAQLGIKSITFVSPEFSHAICGVDIDGKGYKMAYGGIRYLVAETTAKVNLGQIAADIADTSKWFAVELYGLPATKAKQVAF